MSSPSTAWGYGDEKVSEASADALRADIARMHRSIFYGRHCIERYMSMAAASEEALQRIASAGGGESRDAVRARAEIAACKELAAGAGSIMADNVRARAEKERELAAVEPGAPLSRLLGKSVALQFEVGEGAAPHLVFAGAAAPLACDVVEGTAHARFVVAPGHLDSDGRIHFMVSTREGELQVLKGGGMAADVDGTAVPIGTAVEPVFCWNTLELPA